MKRTRNPSRSVVEAGVLKWRLRWAFGLAPLGTLKKLRVPGVDVPLVVRATELESSGETIVAVVAGSLTERDDGGAVVVGATDGVYTAESLLEIDAHRVAEVMLALGRLGKLPPEATLPLRRLLTPVKMSMRRLHGARGARLEYDSLSQIDQERVARAVIHGVVHVRR